MRKRIFGKKLKRTTNQRKELFRSLMRAMILSGRIKTTEAKAKAVRPDLEKLVTFAKKKGDGAYRDLLKRLVQEELVEKMIKTIAPKFESRPGGYTRILKIGDRIKDSAPMVYLEWTERVEEVKSVKGKVKGKKDEKKQATKPVEKKLEVRVVDKKTAQDAEIIEEKPSNSNVKKSSPKRGTKAKKK